MTTQTTPQIQTGTWEIDPSHSAVEFSVRHMMVAKVKGRFTSFRGTIEVGEEAADSRVEATIDLVSVDTNDEKRDAHLRSPEFFDVERYPEMTFISRRVRQDGDHWVVEGDLSVHGVTHPVSLELEPEGVGIDPWGGLRAGFTARTVINRKDFGLDWNVPLDGGGVLVGEKVNVSLEVEAVRA